MKRYSHVVVSVLATLAVAVTLAVAGTVAAQDGGFTAESTGLTRAGETGGYNVEQECEQQEGGCIPQIVGRLISALLGIFGALFLVLIMWGGVQYMLAGGDPGRVKKARETLVNAIIGMIVVALSYAIAQYVIQTIAGAASSATGAGGAGPL